MKVHIDTNNLDDYRTFLRIKQLPHFSFTGRVAEFPDEYAGRLNLTYETPRPSRDYEPHPALFDYQRDVASIAIRKQKYAAFVRPGLGKTLIETEFARHAANCLPTDRRVLIVTTPLVVRQMTGEIRRFYGEDGLRFTQLSSRELPAWILGGPGERIGLTNWEALKKTTPQGCLGGLIGDETHYLSNAYGQWGTTFIRLGRGLDWKLSATGTPAPNDQIEYGPHLVFLDQFPNTNSYLAKFFVNRGQTNNRWELRPHATEPFYRALSHCAVFINDPGTYGWKDNAGTIPPVHVHIHNIEMTAQQERMTCQKLGMLFPTKVGGIVSRGALGQIAKGHYKGVEVDTLKPAFIRELANNEPEKSVIIWCLYDKEQDSIASQFDPSDVANVHGKLPINKKLELLDDFLSGKRKKLVTKSRVCGLGLNLQISSKHIFSGLQDSYLQFAQNTARSNRVGSTDPLDAHIPATDIEMPMIETVLKKARRIKEDTEEQERIFKTCRDWMPV